MEGPNILLEARPTPHPSQPARHGDTLEAKPEVTLADLIERDTRRLVANALRFMSMQTQLRRDMRARQFYDDAARLFD